MGDERGGRKGKRKRERDEGRELRWREEERRKWIEMRIMKNRSQEDKR